MIVNDAAIGDLSIFDTYVVCDRRVPFFYHVECEFYLVFRVLVSLHLCVVIDSHVRHVIRDRSFVFSSHGVFLCVLGEGGAHDSYLYFLPIDDSFYLYAIYSGDTTVAAHEYYRYGAGYGRNGVCFFLRGGRCSLLRSECQD